MFFTTVQTCFQTKSSGHNLPLPMETIPVSVDIVFRYKWTIYECTLALLLLGVDYHRVTDVRSGQGRWVGPFIKWRKRDELRPMLMELESMSIICVLSHTKLGAFAKELKMCKREVGHLRYTLVCVEGGRVSVLLFHFTRHRWMVGLWRKFINILLQGKK